MSCSSELRILGNGECYCPIIGYYSIDEDIACYECDYKCEKCTNNATNCTSCSHFSRLIENNCECLEGFYELIDNKIECLGTYNNINILYINID